jgi:hypothetical protein
VKPDLPILMTASRRTRTSGLLDRFSFARSGVRRPRFERMSTFIEITPSIFVSDWVIPMCAEAVRRRSDEVKSL